jgi:glycosyltransferase involved in cell wall biosynthesis
MVAPFPEERPEAPIADRYVFQSYFQREKYLPLIGIPPEHGVLIRGAFDASEFQHNPLPHMPGKPFIVGKLCRAYNTDGQPALEKYPADLWAQYARISHPIHARVMGWGPEIEEKCGPPPSWAEVLPQGAETVQQFLESIHCLVPGIGCCLENWPRIGLEASAVGTPVIAENRGGWKNMLSSLAMAATVDEQAWKVAAIAYGHKVYGMSVDWGSRLHQESIARSWLDLFRELAA